MIFEETSLYMIRHGELKNRKNLNFTGQMDIPLTKKGLSQTLYHIKGLSKLEISLILSSDLSRTVVPAKIYGETFRCPVKSLAELREINAGKWSNRDYNEIMKKDPCYLKKRIEDPVNVPFPEGESLKDLQKRVIPVIDRALYAYSGKNILLIGHAGTIRVIILHYLNLPLTHFFKLEVDYGSLSVLRFFKDGNVTLKLFNVRK